MPNPRVLVVVSYYNARPDDRLDMLLSQLREVPAGMDFETVVVVNRAVDEDLAIAAKHPGVEVCYRENSGYNIGAWNHGWHRFPGRDLYVFLQDECLIARKHWLRRMAAGAMAGKGRLVGECLVDPAETWAESQSSYESFYASRGFAPSRWDAERGDLHTPSSIQRFLREQGIGPQPTMRHLRSLVLCAPGRLLEDMGGFPCGDGYREAVGAEIGCSQRANAFGYPVRQAALLPFTYVIHPQWMAERCAARTLEGVLRHALRRIVSTPLRMAARRARRQLRA
jgi:hypothetical protein